MKAWLERRFRLAEHGTSVRVEVPRLLWPLAGRFLLLFVVRTRLAR